MCQYVSMSPLMHRYNRGKPNPPSQNKALNNSFKSIQRTRLNTDEIWCVLCFAFHVSFFFIFFSFLTRSTFTWDTDLAMDPVHCTRDPLLFERPHISLEWHCQWVPCTVHGTHKHLFSPKL